jgi:Cof subfamily protein (haloacid dehalogenase superfamily)
MQNNEKIKLVATDLDGTFLKNDKSISKKNLDSLHLIGEKGIVRVAATGRNLNKTCEVIPRDVPFDYIIFSSGAGVYDWQNNKLLFSRNISTDVVNNLSNYLSQNEWSFHLFRPVPDNHICWYFRGKNANPEFERYFEFHNSFAEPFPENERIDSEACQFLVILPNDPDLFEELKSIISKKFPGLKIVRTTSPLHTGYIWMEIFHEDVSKGNGVKILCRKKHIGNEYTLGIGNDYNDLDLLEFTRYSYLVENGPRELKHLFRTTMSNEDDAFAKSISKHL